MRRDPSQGVRAAGRTVTRSLIGAAVALALGAAAMTGCSSSSSPEDRVCDARTDVTDSVDAVRSDVTAGNLGDAKDGLDEVRSSLADLRDAVGDLAESEAEPLTASIDDLRSDLDELGSATEPSDVTAGLAAVLTEATSLLEGISTAADCSDG